MLLTPWSRNNLSTNQAQYRKMPRLPDARSHKGRKDKLDTDLDVSINLSIWSRRKQGEMFLSIAGNNPDADVAET